MAITSERRASKADKREKIDCIRKAIYRLDDTNEIHDRW